MCGINHWKDKSTQYLYWWVFGPFTAPFPSLQEWNFLLSQILEVFLLWLICLLIYYPGPWMFPRYSIPCFQVVGELRKKDIRLLSWVSCLYFMKKGANEGWENTWLKPDLWFSIQLSHMHRLYWCTDSTNVLHFLVEMYITYELQKAYKCTIIDYHILYGAVSWNIYIV
jgi:hypothetical protein